MIDDESAGSPAVIAGVILAGGRAQRMGGGDKGLVRLAGRPIIGHVIERLAPQVDRLALNANGDPARFAAFGLPVIPDGVPGHPGPLAGILAGLDWAAGIGAPAIVTAAADTPFFPLDLVRRLKAAAKAAETRVAVAAGTDGLHPTFGLWATSDRGALEAALAAGTRRVLDWAEACQAATAVFPDAGDAFFNVNTPADRLRAETIAAGC
ncbi:MAG: molybdenum cofactor guanylyltransferase MobA [Amaricoccus sp.]